MIGLTYIRKDIFHMTLSWLSSVVNISRQGVTDWESKRTNLSEDRLDILENIFGVSKQWYNKEINEIDKLKIDNEVLNNIMTTQKYSSINFHDNTECRNIHFEKTTADLDKFMKIEDIKERNYCILQQITENEKKIQLLEINSQINNIGNELIENSTIFGLYINCLNTFKDIVNKVKDANTDIKDIKLADLKKYLINYEHKNNDI